MSTSDVIFYSSFAITLGLSSMIYVRARAGIAHGRDRKECSNQFTIGTIVAGFVSGFLIYFGVLHALDAVGYRVNVGHGEVLIAAPFFNLILGLALGLVGRIPLQWDPVNW